jgi:hypothetical protein
MYFKCTGSKRVTDTSVTEEITERTENAAVVYHLVRDILWQWEI